MKLLIKKSALAQNIAQFLRSAGYINIYDRKTGKESYARHLARGDYPRLHLYIVDETETVTLDLHLDHKETSYQGQHMHNAEYSGDLVESEMRRLATLAGVDYRRNNQQEANAAEEIPQNNEPKVANKTSDSDDKFGKFAGKMSALGHGELSNFLIPAMPKKKRRWWNFSKE